MPRFYFDVHDGKDIMDDLGQELPGLREARQHALVYAGHLIADMDEAFWLENDWRVDVRDHQGVLLFSLTLLNVDAPAVQRHAST